MTDKVDLFRKPIPHFSHNGKQYISSLPGACCTLVITILVLGLALDRILAFADVLHKTEYKIVQKVYEPAVNATEKNFTDIHFAVGVQYKEEFQWKMDDNFLTTINNYVTLRVQAKEKSNGATTSYDLGIQRCATVDLDRFY